MTKLGLIRKDTWHLLARLRRKRGTTEMIPRGEIDTNVALRAMSMENSLLQSYRALFIGIEAVLLASAFALTKAEDNVGNILTWLAVAGLVIGVFWIVVCESKAKDVDRWMKYLTKGAKEMRFFSYMRKGCSLQGGRLARYWFNLVMPVSIMALWIWMIVEYIIS